MGRGRGRGNRGGGHRGGHGGRGGEKRRGEKRDGGENPDWNGGGDWTENRDNEDFTAYYKEQGNVPEDQWEDFMATLRKPLPVTFRINGSGRFADHLRDKLQTDFFQHFSSTGFKEEGLQAPKPLPWYPNNHAWHMDWTRQQLRKLPLLESVFEWLKKANENGSISRQEAVSMVPPLFLDVKPHHRVLDMCAAPGSKTQQLLEAIHFADDKLGQQQLPTGFVVANDADYKRCSLLTHQTKRVCSPCLLVTNHSAELFPEIRKKLPNGEVESLSFDRILADVPCSGDGTMRKSPDIWKRWSVASGNGLHLIQLRIALQGAKVLNVGGRMVYSTCTFNPIENEAVVAELLLRCKGALELVDVRDELPALRRMPGMKHWKVRDKFRFYNSWEDAKDMAFKLDPSMFPTEEKSALPLERCMRFLPHHQDTGGFFVCVLKKVADMPAFEIPSMKARMTIEPKASIYERAEAKAAAAKAGGAAGDVVEEGEGDEGGKEVPLEMAKVAAKAALEAATLAVAAFADKDMDAMSKAVKAAEQASARASMAQALNAKDEKKKAEREKRSRQEEVQAGGEAKKVKVKPKEEEEEMEGEPDHEEEEDGLVVKKEEEGEEENDGEASHAAASSSKSKPSWIRGGGGRNREGEAGRHSFVDPIVPVEDRTLLDPLETYYGLKSDFPLTRQLIARNSDAVLPKRLYFVSQAIIDLLVRDEKEQLKVIATGLKVFEKQDVKEGLAEGGEPMCRYRLAQEGLPFMLPYLNKQKLVLKPNDFMTLLTERSLLLPSAEVQAPKDSTAPEVDKGERKNIIKDAKLLEQVQGVKPGCVVIVPSKGDGVGGALAGATLALSAWKGKASIAIMVDRAETAQMVDRVHAMEAEAKKNP